MQQDEKKAEKIQIQSRMDKRIVPVDKLSNHMWNFSADDYADIISTHFECGCVEGVVKGAEIMTPYWLELIEDYESLLPPNAFDREVLFALISAYAQGEKYVTFSSTLRDLTGSNRHNFHKEQYSAIKAAVDKLMKTVITVDLKPLLTAIPRYAKNYSGKYKLVSPLLPCKYAETTVNGQETLIVKLLDESPLMTVAKLKKQVLTYSADPLYIPGQNNTPQIITVKNYLLRRVELIKQQRLDNSSILLDTVHTECNIDGNFWKRQDVRKVVVEVLTAFRDNGLIKNFELQKQGRYFRAVKIKV